MAASRAIAGLLIVVPAAVATLLVVADALGDLSAAREAHLRLAESYGAEYERLLTLDQGRARVAVLKRTLAQQRRLLPDAAGMEVRAGELEASVRKAAAAARVAALELSIDASVPREFYAQRPFAVSASGDYRALVQFVRAVSSGSGELRMLRRLSLAPQRGGGRLELKIDAVAFAHLDEGAARTARGAKGER